MADSEGKRGRQLGRSMSIYIYMPYARLYVSSFQPFPKLPPKWFVRDGAKHALDAAIAEREELTWMVTALGDAITAPWTLGEDHILKWLALNEKKAAPPPALGKYLEALKGPLARAAMRPAMMDLQSAVETLQVRTRSRV